MNTFTQLLMLQGGICFGWGFIELFKPGETKLDIAMMIVGAFACLLAWLRLDRR